MPSDVPRHHRSTSPDRAEVLMVVLVTIASVVCGWIAVSLLSGVGAAWLGAVAGLPVAMLPASIGTVILRWHPRRAASSATAHAVGSAPLPGALISM